MGFSPMIEPDVHERQARRFRDDDAARIIDHAIRLDAARKSGMSVEDLHDIAREIGIAPDSVDDALRALEASGWVPGTATEAAAVAPPDERPRWGPRIARALRLVLVPLAGLVGGLASSGYVVGPPGSADLNGGTALTALLVGGSLALFLHHRRRRAVRSYQLDLLCLWGGFTVGWLLSHDSLDIESFAVLAGGWLALAAFGRWGLARRADPQADEVIPVA